MRHRTKTRVNTGFAGIGWASYPHLLGRNVAMSIHRQQPPPRSLERLNERIACGEPKDFRWHLRNFTGTPRYNRFRTMEYRLSTRC